MQADLLRRRAHASLGLLPGLGLISMAQFTYVIQAVLTQAVAVKAFCRLHLFAVGALLLSQSWLVHSLPPPPLLLVILSSTRFAHAVVPICIHLVAVVVC